MMRSFFVPFLPIVPIVLLSFFYSLVSFANSEQQLSEKELAWLFGESDSEILDASPSPKQENNKKSTLHQLIEMDKNLLKQYQEYIEGQKVKRNYTTAELEAMKIQVSDILKSGTFIGLIPKKARLIRISDNSLHYITREIKVKAFRQTDFENCILLENKDGSVSYKVALKDITPIDDMLGPDEPPTFFTPITKKKSEASFYDSPITFQTEFNFHLGMNAANFTRDLINDSDFIGFSNRYEVIHYAQWDFPIKLGLNLGLQHDYANLKNNSQLSGQTFFFAPALKANFADLGLDLGVQNLFTTAMLKSSILSNMTISGPNGNDEFSFYTLALTLGVHKEKKWSLGNFIYGFDIQRQWARVTGDNAALNLSNNASADDSITFKVGFGRDW